LLNVIAAERQRPGVIDGSIANSLIQGQSSFGRIPRLQRFAFYLKHLIDQLAEAVFVKQTRSADWLIQNKRKALVLCTLYPPKRA
jgi:hypothetical protein